MSEFLLSCPEGYSDFTTHTGYNFTVKRLCYRTTPEVPCFEQCIDYTLLYNASMFELIISCRDLLSHANQASIDPSKS